MEGNQSAYKYGIENNYDYVLFMDADLTQNPESILDFKNEMAAGKEFIKASRYIKGSQVIGVPRKRVIISTIGNMIARIAFHVPITDYTNGYRAVRTSLANHFNLESTGFPILVEEMWQAKFYTRSFSEVTYTLSYRGNEGDSKFLYNTMVYKEYLKYCLYSLLVSSQDINSMPVEVNLWKPKYVGACNLSELKNSVTWDPNH
jgi:hypothetical protein